MKKERLKYIKRLASTVRNLKEEEKVVLDEQIKDPDFIQRKYGA